MHANPMAFLVAIVQILRNTLVTQLLYILSTLSSSYTITYLHIRVLKCLYRLTYIFFALRTRDYRQRDETRLHAVAEGEVSRWLSSNTRTHTHTHTRVYQNAIIITRTYASRKNPEKILAWKHRSAEKKKKRTRDEKLVVVFAFLLFLSSRCH